ncbi:MAG: hypothetical protein IJF92_05705 [Bacilli bacterium]|nr:hypothetical protein [Bacilli bacterium]
MFNVLRMSLKIDINYAINSFIYTLKKAPIFKDLFVDDSLYKSHKAKSIIRVLAIILSSFRIIFYKCIYISILYIISHYLNSKNTVNTFIHIYVLLTILGMFVNNKLLSPSTKKYFSIVLFNMDAKKFFKSDLFIEIIPSFIVNFITISILINVKIALLLSLFAFLSRIIGEAFNIWYYKKYKYLVISNLVLYWTLLFIVLGLCCLPFINIYFTYKYLLLLVLLFIPLMLISYYYINKVNDYKLIYKKLNTLNTVIDSDSRKGYDRQNIVEVKNKDKYINNKKIKGKKGYDLFNTIFFERHKEILLRSAKNFSLIIFVVIIGSIFFIKGNEKIAKGINYAILNRLSWAVIIMYFINRGSILTQAMFYNCDHSMLTFNFYREPKVILNLFKKRLITIIKVNLMPAIVMSIGVVVLLYLSGGSTNIINYITIPIFILSLSVFFSVHYLVIYYLLQPYNKYMKIKSLTYTLVLSLTYIFSYSLTKLVMSSLIFSIIGVLSTIAYVLLSLLVVYRFAPITFKIR